MKYVSPVIQIEQIASLVGHHIAIRNGDRAISYAELMQKSGAVAANLKEAGIVPGQFVGIALTRSIEWVVAMLGILKAGAAYIPLDPSYPLARLQFCASDSRATFVVTDEVYRIISPHNALLISDLTVSNTLMKTPTEIDGNKPVYMLYTSGSTGQPKGVVVSLNAISYQMDWFIREFAFSSDDIFVQKTSVAFDASVWEYLAPLMIGGTMIIADSDPASIIEAVYRHRATVLQVVPTVLDALIIDDNFNQMESLRVLFCGGEALPRRLVELVQTRIAIPVINLYGPTEATVQCAFHVCSPSESSTERYVPIGYPIPGSEFIIGEYEGFEDGGELIIEGPGIADGYHLRSELTNKQFGVSEKTGNRFYRSGDLVRRNNDGIYVFLGRIDDQVKLRGIRIELSDIEETIKIACPHVDDVAVIVNEAEQIEAFIKCDATKWYEEESRQAIAAMLPSFMMPSIFTIIISIPCLPNGKRDRLALKALSTEHREAQLQRDSDHSPTITETLSSEIAIDRGNKSLVEQAIRTLWKGMLPGTISNDTHFFQSGGHSLLAMQLISSLNKSFSLRLSAASLFAHPTFGTLAEMVSIEVAKAQHSNVSGGFVKIAGQQGCPRVWFLHPAGGAIWCYQDIAMGAAQSIESYGIECLPLDSNSLYENDLKNMAKRYADVLLKVQPTGPYMLCGYSFGGNVAFEMCVYLKLLGIDVDLLILLDTYICRRNAYEELDFVVSYANKFTNGRNDAADKEALRAMQFDVRQQYLLELGIAGGHLPQDATLADVERGLAMWVANNTAAETHEVTAHYNGPTLFIRCTLNSRNSLDGWPEVIDSLETVSVDADHFSIYKQPIANSVAAIIVNSVSKLSNEHESL